MTSPIVAPLLAILVWIGACLSPAVSAQTDHPVVIVNQSIALQSLNRNQLRAIFALQLKIWPDGQAVRVHVFSYDADVHRRFCVRVLRLFPYQLERVWDRLLYSGLGQAPQVVPSAEEMERRVAETPGAIGYLDAPPKFSTVRVLEVRP